MTTNEIERLAMERRDKQEAESWYQVTYCDCCGIPTGVNGPETCEVCGDDSDYFTCWDD